MVRCMHIPRQTVCLPVAPKKLIVKHGKSPTAWVEVECPACGNCNEHGVGRGGRKCHTTNCHNHYELEVPSHLEHMWNALEAWSKYRTELKSIAIDRCKQLKEEEKWEGFIYPPPPVKAGKYS